MNKIKLYTYKILIHPLSMMATSILVIVLVRSIIYPTIIYAEEINTGSGYLLIPDMQKDAAGNYYFELTTKNTILICCAILGFIMFIGYMGTPDITTLPEVTPPSPE